MRTAALVGLMLLGCSSSSSSADGPSTVSLHAYGGGTACVAFPDVGYRVFPYDAAAGKTTWPTCPLACSAISARAGASTAPLDQALPAGPCDDEGAACTSPLIAGWTPPCKETGGPGNGYTCTCRSHRWRCVLSSQGGAMGEGPRCVDPACDIASNVSANEVCACGKCYPLCTSDADCKTGTCQENTLRLPLSASCAGPDECATKSTGFCN